MKETIKVVSAVIGFLLVVLTGALLLPEMEYYRSIFHYLVGSLIGLYFLIILQVLLFFWFKKTALIKKILIIFNFISIGTSFFLLEYNRGDIRDAWVMFYLVGIVIPIIIILIPKEEFQKN